MSEYSLSPTATPAISFQASVPAGSESATINWSTTLEYATSGGKGPYSTAGTFTSVGSGPVPRTFTATGGNLTVNAAAQINGSNQAAAPNTVFITGSAIPISTITAQLTALYSGATPLLLTGIAMKESSYRQFARRELYGYSARWPNEAYDGGSHIGLMMMPVSQAHAWDWTVNAQDGADLFSSKLAVALSLEKKIVAAHSGLRAFTGIERENMALVLYGPYAHSTSLSQQYYAPVAVPVSTANPRGGWEWQVNSPGNANGVAYADSVRSQIQ
jgi:hypothetical protein